MDREEIKELVLDKIESLFNDVKHDTYISSESKGEVKCYLSELKVYVKNL